MPGCAEAGVLGVVCGVIASIQGVETIKLLWDSGEPLCRPPGVLDAPGEGIPPGQIPSSPAPARCCGDHPTITDLITIRHSGGMPPTARLVERRPSEWKAVGRLNAERGEPPRF